MSKTTKKASFFKLVLIPFFVISLFAQFYANAFLLAFLVDNRPAVELVKKDPGAGLLDVMRVLKDSSTFVKSVKGNVNVSMDKDGKSHTHIQGEFKTFAVRIILLLLLYLWLNPFFTYARTGDKKVKEQACRRYNSFYRDIFSYLLITHVIMFFSTTWWHCPPEYLWNAIAFYLLWFVIECYLFYLFLEPTLFMYVSGIFADPGQLKPSRSSLSIYGKLITMLVFLMLLPLAILAAYIHKEYILIMTYQTTALTLIVTSAAFLIGNLQLLYKSVQEPINFLVEKMQKLASGDFDVQTSVLFDDEIGRLKTNFNMMVGQLQFPIQLGVGLNTGNLIAGNIGTVKRFEYTVIGDTVNVASRIESLSKDLSHAIILSEATVEHIPEEFRNAVKIEKSDLIKIKGKSEPAPVYKLIS